MSEVCPTSALMTAALTAQMCVKPDAVAITIILKTLNILLALHVWMWNVMFWVRTIAARDVMRISSVQFYFKSYQVHLPVFSRNNSRSFLPPETFSMFWLSCSCCSPQDLNRPANRRITEGTKQHWVLITEQQESVRSQTKPEPCMCVFSLQSLSRSTAVDLVNSSNVLQQETKMLLEGKMLVSSITVPLSRFFWPVVVQK